ncbi:alpha/beta hydrolase [Paenibacillus sp. SYP-B3998]|uniref:Alpha/beta hydrolase n=1 Tax=Paenibacillus sp. SYP-B3998 TaxID=2678564 RepID=A0A6G3ZUE3_9BACL|nr:alpha/beta fold hydrolase [Paenibacillus sp. SYP-B3998]NEW05324.1 alpha/beta hydrolase [Paenibacillus sp. SYP-B3998]
MEPKLSEPFELGLGPDRIVRGDFYAATLQPSRGTLLVCHGYKGFKDWGMFPHVARSLAEEVNVVSINLSHNGVGADLLSFSELEKFAQATYSQDVEDLAAVVAFIQSDLTPEQEDKPIFLLGHSRGAGVCLIYAMDHPELIAGVLSWNGVANVDLLTKEEKAQMRSTGRAYTMNGRTKQNMPLALIILEDMEHNRERFDLVNRVKKATFPIILIQGTEDGARLVAGSAQLVANNPTINWIRVAGGNHTFGTVHPYQGETLPLIEAINVTKATISQLLG